MVYRGIETIYHRGISNKTKHALNLLTISHIIPVVAKSGGRLTVSLFTNLQTPSLSLSLKPIHTAWDSESTIARSMLNTKKLCFSTSSGTTSRPPISAAYLIA